MKATIQFSGDCPDCHVKPGERHLDGCDIALCTACGYQRISCGHRGSAAGWEQLWTGIFPGKIEQAMYGLGSLNEVREPPAQWNQRMNLWLRAVGGEPQ